MNPPVIEQNITGYKFVWHDENISILVSGLNYKHDSLKGHVTVKTSLPGYNDHLHEANFNFSSTRSQTDLVRTLARVCEEVNWHPLIEQLRVKTLQLFRQGNPVEILDAESEIPKLQYILYPIIPKNHLSLIFGEGGTGKSTLALLFSLAVATKDKLMDYGFSVNGDGPHVVLYLDYETERDTIGLQFKNLCQGLDRRTNVFYRRCDLPLLQDLENIKEVISSINASLVIIDSVGIACGGDLTDAAMANSFTLALRSLKTTNFLISHTSKDRSDKKTPFGSVYFFNNARNIWEVKKTQSEDDNFISVGLFHRKSNISKLFSPIGLKFKYSDNQITVEREDISDIEGFEKELSLRQRIKNLLLSEGVLTIKDIAGQLGAGEQTVRSRLNEMRKKGDVIKQDDKFAMAYE